MNPRTVSGRVSALLIALIFALDQYTKQLVVASWNLGESLPVIPGFFSLTYLPAIDDCFSLSQPDTIVRATRVAISRACIFRAIIDPSSLSHSSPATQAPAPFDVLKRSRRSSRLWSRLFVWLTPRLTRGRSLLKERPSGAAGC